MRSSLLLMLVGAGALWALANPAVGVLMWTWISIMNPHRYTWEAANYPVAAIIGGATLLGLLWYRERRFFVSAPSGWLMLFMLWVCITYPFSFSTGDSYSMLTRVLKIDFMILVALVVLHTRKHIELLVWVLVFSLGFYGVKGGLFTLATGGSYRVWGPPGSFIEGNNEVALALIMTIPLMFYLREQASKIWQRHAWLGAMMLCAIAAIGSQSRGALLAIVAMLALLWLRGRQKMLFGLLIVLGGVLLLAFMPDAWHERMDTISTYKSDASAMGRINAWWMTWNLARDHFFGGGFAIYDLTTFRLYAPEPENVHAAHSIYFQVLGEHGFIGLFLFLAMWLATWRSAGWLRRNAAGDTHTDWAAMLGAMCQVSLLGYAVGGAFLSLAYFDLPYNLVVLVVLARRWVEQHQAANGTGPRAKTKRAAARGAATTAPASS